MASRIKPLPNRDQRKEPTMGSEELDLRALIERRGAGGADADDLYDGPKEEIEEAVHILLERGRRTGR
jgi:hypothetical protein